MNAKGINKIEQHVEKIVLAVAAAGALYMGYLAIQPVNLPETASVPIDKLEENIAQDVGRLKELERKNAETPITLNIPDYAGIYRRLIGADPNKPTLDRTLLDTPVARMGPTNLSLNGSGTVLPPQYEAVTPKPVDPEDVMAEVRQQPVTIAPPATPGGGTPPATPASLQTVDKNAVLVDGYIPVGKMLVEMAEQKNRAALPPQLQRASIYRIEVQRRERIGNQWTDWKAVPPSAASVAPSTIDWKNLGSDMGPILDRVDTEFKQTVIPDFYNDDKGATITAPNVGKPAPSEIQSESRQLQNDLAKAKNQGMSAVMQPTADTTGTVSTDPAQIRAQMVIPFAFWDETVEAGHIYQYQTRVVYVNPTYHFPAGLKDPSKKDQPTLVSNWVAIAGEVQVKSDIEFFVMGTGFVAGGNHIDVRVFKRTAGKWYYNDLDVQPGTGIAGKVSLVDQQPVTQLDVDTGYRLVDVVNAGNDTRAILIDPAGNLVTRDAGVDHNSKIEQELFNGVEHRPAPPPATAPTGGAPRGGTRGGGTGAGG